jgi:hypothetical protein
VHPYFAASLLSLRTYRPPCTRVVDFYFVCRKIIFFYFAKFRIGKYYEISWNIAKFLWQNLNFHRVRYIFEFYCISIPPKIHKHLYVSISVFSGTDLMIWIRAKIPGSGTLVRREQ